MPEHVIYVIGHDDGPQKIGLSRSLKSRRRSLAGKHGKGIKVHSTVAVPDADVFLIDRLVHFRLRDRRVGGEWFDVTKEEAHGAILDGIAAYAAGDRAPSQATCTERAAMVLPSALVARIDAWRAAAPGKLRNRSEAIRDLVDIALDA